jgi:hypothetical protein
MTDYSIYKKHITENLFDFFMCGSPVIYDAIHEAVKDEKDIEKVLQTYFSTEKFYEAQKTIEFNSQKLDEYYRGILQKVIHNYKAK